MSTTHPSTLSSTVSTTHFGSMTTLASAWTLAGGIAGGVLAAGFVATGRMHPEVALIVTAVLAGSGSVLGLVHGAILGHLGRSADDHCTAAEIVLGLMAAAAGMVLANLLSHWLVLAAMLARAGNTTGWLSLMLLVPVCAAVLVWATVLGWHTLEPVYMRWQDHRLGAALIAGAFAVTAFVFMALRPAIPGTSLQLSWWATLVLAAIATLWIAAPAIIAGLRLAHRSWWKDSA
jgi:hypothetical protein